LIDLAQVVIRFLQHRIGTYRPLGARLCAAVLRLHKCGLNEEAKDSTS
jgi:hypothetical protein